MINKKARTSGGLVIVWIMIITIVAYVANFGGFHDTVDIALGTNSTSVNQTTSSGGLFSIVPDNSTVIMNVTNSTTTVNKSLVTFNGIDTFSGRGN